MGGMLWFLEGAGDGSWFGFDDCFAVSAEPVSIWTTCLKVEVSAWTKVVG